MTARAAAALHFIFELRAVRVLMALGARLARDLPVEPWLLCAVAGGAGRRLVPALREAAEFDWDVAALPRHQDPASILHSDAYCMTKASKEKDAAWRFVEYALGPEGAPVISRTGRTVPSLREVAESDAFLDPSQKPANAKVFLDAVPTIQSVPTVSTWPEIEDAAEPILEVALYEGGDAAEVAQEIDDATRDIFARAEE